MVVLKQLIILPINLCFIVLWTYVAILRMLYRFITHPTTFFKVTSRKSPDVLTSGWNHRYVTLPDQKIRLHYVEAGDAQKPLMLFLHGFPEFWYSWRYQLNEFKKSYRVVAIDLRGYGDSDKPAGIKSYTIPDLVADVKSVISALGASSCTLVAHDWGGVVGWQVALQHPELVEKYVVMNSPHPTAFGQFLNGNFTQLLKSWYIFFFQVPYLPELYMRSCDFGFFDDLFKFGTRNPKAFSDADIEAFKYTFGRDGALTPPINYYRASLLRMDAVRPKGVSARVRVPTLIIWGTKDLALDTGLASLSASFCDNVRVEYADGASHWVQQDEPDMCNKYMWQFLQEKSS